MISLCQPKGKGMTEDFNPVEWITTKEAADLIEYDVSHIRRLVREGLVRGIKRGREIGF
jgi:excisionase family DNA binding protein